MISTNEPKGSTTLQNDVVNNMPVNGLKLSNINVDDIQTNVRLLLAIRNKYERYAENSKRISKKMSTFFELGISYASAEKGIYDFNDITENNTCNPLLVKISDMIANNYNKLNTKDGYIPNFKNANIIIRKYDKGGIGHHKDKIDELFEPIVYTLIVKNESNEDGCLDFLSDDKKISYSVPEKEGTIIIMEDESLYNFTHGVNPCNRLRISVTVRFYREDRLKKLEGYDESKKMKSFDMMVRNKIINQYKKMDFVKEKQNIKDNSVSELKPSDNKSSEELNTSSSAANIYSKPRAIENISPEHSYVRVTSDDSMCEFFSLKKGNVSIDDFNKEEFMLKPYKKNLHQQDWVSQTESPNGFHRGMLYPLIPKITNEIVKNTSNTIELNVIAGGSIFFNDF
tara:strand:- start:3870 stop:5063 length:1194 start_codon:yes stop_codon:yes gene_type:complete